MRIKSSISRRKEDFQLTPHMVAGSSASDGSKLTQSASIQGWAIPLALVRLPQQWCCSLFAFTCEPVL
jgi:hypothetical protein